MSTLFNDLRFAFRFLSRNAGFSLTAIVVIALGISLSAALFAVVKGTLLNPWPYEGYDRMVSLRGDFPEQARTEFSLWSAREVDDLRATGVFDHVIAGYARNVNLSYQGRPERVRAARITPNAFQMLGVPAAQGRVLTAEDAQPGAAPVVLISHDFWRRQLNGQSIDGQTLRIGDVVHQIVGVMPEQFKFWDRRLWLPLALEASADRSRRELYVQARLAPDVTVADAEARLAVVTSTWHQRFPEVAEYRGIVVRLTPLVDAVLRDLRPMPYVLLYAVCGVLLAAASNVANAMLAKSLTREGELATRRALGASARQLARHLVFESLLVSITGGLVGVALAAFMLPQILSRIPYGYVPAEATVALDGSILLTAVVAAMLCGLIAAVVPAVRAALIDPVVLLRNAGTRSVSGRSHRLRSTLTAMQLAISVLVVGLALTALGESSRMLSRDPGFAPDGIWTSRIAVAPSNPTERAQIYQRIARELAAEPRLSGAAMASSFPVGELARTLASKSALTTADLKVDADVVAASPEFFTLLRLRLVSGRFFDAFDVEGTAGVAVVSQTLADRLWPSGDAVGRTIFAAAGGEATIVGVVADVVADPADTRVRHTLFRPLLQLPPAEITLGIKSSEDLLRPLAAVVAKVDPDIPVYGAELLGDARAATIGPQLLAVLLLALFASVALILSTVGLYAIMSQSVLERLREMSIRITFGAPPNELFRRELARGGKVILASIGIGLTLAIVALPLANGPTIASAWVPLAAAALMVGVTGLLACGIPAYTGSRAAIDAPRQ